MIAIRKILVPTDFSPQADLAFRLACSLAQSHQAELIVLHVVPPPASWGEAVARRQPDSYERQLWEEYLLPLQPTEPGVQISHRLEEGDAEKVIVRIAEELGCDLIVLGTHGRTGLHRLLMGSVAEHVLRTAPCPVLTVRLPAGAVQTPMRPQAHAAAEEPVTSSPCPWPE